MDIYSGLSVNAKKKIQLYAAALYLFGKGKSHPQIIEILKLHEPDESLIVSMVNNAMHEKWDKLYEETKNLFSQGKLYDEVIEEISKTETDTEIVKWICDSWYQWKIFYADNVIESASNMTEGSQWAIIGVIVIPILFLIHASLISKILWIVACVFAIIQWLIGIKQRKLSKQIQKIFQANGPY